MADLLDEVLDRLEKVSVTDDWSDEEIIERYDNAAPHPDCPDIFGYPGSVRILSDDTVCKASGSASLILAEVNALEFVRAHTSIPVPQVRRVLTGPTRSRFLMEYIKGRPLARLWLCMTLWQRFIVAWTLRSYIRQLRVASAAYERRTVPGPMGDSPQGFFTPLWMFGDRFKGPYNTWAEFCDELNRRYGKRGLGLFNPTEDLVLTHGDLTARNIVVGEDGRLWLVDWGMSGFYPPFVYWLLSC
ncbi:hypothetical protein OE88DRAFT_1651587 [Heliocybe sulcata]|uniref:Aminoglycoside phosphotransferase domain-containing protein n=1 Tax=Heliocybe sulcata TaxID=5364 RepID=A0A5C3NKG7_9AGAM|nr:hypothetical protein OE88DRAFT_1651587 [Heliocybe sulcata]